MSLGKKIGFEKSIPYHILSRAVEGREIFEAEEDCLRFIFQMYAANIGRPVPNIRRKDIIKASRAILNGEDLPEKFIIVEHSPLVYFLSFALVNNHHHFELIAKNKADISKYMQKLHTAFSMYFNLKHNRKGNLFEKPYKTIPIQTPFQSDAILRYINVINPLDVYQPGWREKGLRNWQGALKFLNEYQFSSFPDLFGKRNSKILAPFEIIKKYLGKELLESREGYIEFIKDYLNQRLMTSLYSLFLE